MENVNGFIYKVWIVDKELREGKGFKFCLISISVGSICGRLVILRLIR